MTTAVPGQWGTRIEIKSETSSRVYVVAEKLDHGQPTGTYGCSCPGWKGYGNCKHLKSSALKSCREPTRPAPRGLGTGDNTSFTDAAYKHYDVRAEGFGSAGEWFRIAEAMAAGRKQYRPPPRARRAPTGLAADLALLDLPEMPREVKDLVRAMRKRARVLHPDFVHPADEKHKKQFPQCPQCAAAAETFTAMQMAYERLVARYPR